MGHLISAQLSEAMADSLRDSGILEEDPIDFCIGKGNESSLLSWLREKVHLHGRKMNAEDLVEKVTGLPLSSSAFLNYLKKKLDLLNTTF